MRGEGEGGAVPCSQYDCRRVPQDVCPFFFQFLIFWGGGRESTKDGVIKKVEVY